MSQESASEMQQKISLLTLNLDLSSIMHIEYQNPNVLNLEELCEMKAMEERIKLSIQDEELFDDALLPAEKKFNDEFLAMITEQVERDMAAEAIAGEARANERLLNNFNPISQEMSQAYAHLLAWNNTPRESDFLQDLFHHYDTESQEYWTEEEWFPEEYNYTTPTAAHPEAEDYDSEVAGEVFSSYSHTAPAA